MNKKQLITIICKFCGKSFEVPHYYKSRYKTCGSKECKFKFHQEIGKRNLGRIQTENEKLVRSLAQKDKPQSKKHIIARTKARLKNESWFNDPEIGNKISEGKKKAFQALPEFEKEKIRENARKVGMHNYVHGNSKEYSKIINNKKMIIWSETIRQRDNYICQKCGCNDKRIEAHHIKPVLLFPEFKYDLDNGITLCPKCHKTADKELSILYH